MAGLTRSLVRANGGKSLDLVPRGANGLRSNFPQLLSLASRHASSLATGQRVRPQNKFHGVSPEKARELWGHGAGKSLATPDPLVRPRLPHLAVGWGAMQLTGEITARGGRSAPRLVPGPRLPQAPRCGVCGPSPLP